MLRTTEVAPERIGLRDHVMKVLLDDKQLFLDRMQSPQSLLDLFYPGHDAQVGIDHQHAVRAESRLVAQQSGNDMMMRLQQGADGRNLGRLIGEITNEHFSC